MWRPIRRQIDRLVLRDPAYRFMFEKDTTGELVALDCETTGLDPWVDDIVSIAAIKIRGNRICTSERLELLVKPSAKLRDDALKVHRLRPMDLAGGLAIEDALDTLLRFVGSRTLVGYYLEFDISMINKYLLQFLGIPLPHRYIEVSSLYYDKVFRRNPGRYVDLRFDTIAGALDLPARNRHDALNDALMAAMMYLKLTLGKPDVGRVPVAGATTTYRS